MAGLNSWALNSIPLNDAGAAPVVIVATGSGQLIGIEQQVAHIGSGALISIEQEVNLNTSGSGVLIEIEQQVMTIGSGALIGIAQKVLSTAEKTFFTRNGWDAVVSLGGYEIPRGQIQEIEVVHSVGDNARATVMLNPGSGTYDLYRYQGKEVVISARVGATFKRLFTGLVDIPRVEVVNEKITLECIANRETLIRNSMTPVVPTIGYYSSSVFGDLRNVFQETNDRMSTIPFDLDFDASNQYTITSWTPKATADYTLGNSNLYREQQPTVRIESSREVVNKVEIVVDYSYQRLHQTSINYSWSTAGLTTCDFLTKGNTLPTRAMVLEAAKAAGWYVENMSYTELWSSGFYQCSGTTIGWTNNRTSVILADSGAVDSNGNKYTTSTPTNRVTLNDVLALGASWQAKRRFAQNVKEGYTLTVQSPQSQLLYGVRENNQRVSIQSDYDISQWEDEKNYAAVFSGTQYASSNTNTYFINKDLDNTELTNAIDTALNQAKTSILRSHRDTEVSYAQFINPDIALRHTVELDTSRIECKGKVKTIKHVLKATGEAVTEVALLLYRGIGSQAETTLTPPARPTQVTPSAIANIALGSRWGQDPSTTAAKKWTGYVGNKWITVATGGVGLYGANTNTYLTNYQESFIVDTPQIPTDKRGDVIYESTASYNVQIPTDALNVIFLDS